MVSVPSQELILSEVQAQGTPQLVDLRFPFLSLYCFARAAVTNHHKLGGERFFLAASSFWRLQASWAWGNATPVSASVFIRSSPSCLCLFLLCHILLCPFLM